MLHTNPFPLWLLLLEVLFVEGSHAILCRWHLYISIALLHDLGEYNNLLSLLSTVDGQ